MFALLVVAALSAQEDKTPTIKEVMKKLHKGNDCLRAKIDKGLKAGEPDWDTVQKETKEFKQMAEALPKNEPPKGTKEAWEKIAKEFVTNATAMDDAAKKKDKKAAQAAHGKMGNAACKSCHTAHKG
jgi:hypothetical protein